MRNPRLMVQLLPAGGAVVVLVLLFCAWPLGNDLSARLAELERGALAAELAQAAVHWRSRSSAEPDGAADWEREMSRNTGAEWMLLDGRGRPAAPARGAESLRHRPALHPEVQRALRGETVIVADPSAPGQGGWIGAAPIVDVDGQVAGVVTAARPSRRGAIRAQLRRRLLVGGSMTGVASFLILWAWAERLRRSVRDMQRAAERLAEGDAAARIPAPATLELAQLADSLNRMSSTLRRTVQASRRQSREQEAIVSSMTDGVLALDPHERVLSINRAACEMLNTDAQRASGASVREVIRHATLHLFILDALNGRETRRETLITLYHPQERVLETRVANLEGDDGQRLGILVILRDLTALYRLERIRRDFVANVSHELKTPITSIKGFIETVLDDTAGVPEQTLRFLRIIAKQTQRMDAIIDDLLILARLENQSGKGILPMQPTALKPLIESACEVCAARAAEKNMEVLIECDDDCRADMSGPLIEQAIVNLVDNAIKYSEPGRPIAVAGRCEGDGLEIRVLDQGCGIEKEHLDRLFERFYRADKVRSRNLGGTGLGLSIVKHIVQVHDGRVSVQSRPGKGSEFVLLIPRRRTAPSQNSNESLTNL